MAQEAVQTGSVTDLRRGVDHIGIACVFVCHDGAGRLLLHKRSARCRDEVGAWDVGAGSLEFGEEFEDAIQREVKEEYCADAKDIRLLGTYNVIRKNGVLDTHWIAMIFAVLVDPEQVQMGEPEKMDAIGWFTKNDLPSPVHSNFPRDLELAQQAGIV